jgi:DNA replication protein DnaC
MTQIELHLSQLRLSGMAQNWKALIETRRHLELSLSEGLEVLLQAEVDERLNRRSDRYRKNARFRYQASLAEVHADASRGLDKALLAQLATGEYISRGESVLITGPTGCGKSFVASALGNHACSQGYKVCYYNLQKLMMRIRLVRSEGSMHKFLERTAKTNLLILDDFGLSRLDQQQCLDLMEIIEDRHGKTATVIAGQLPVSSWYDIIAEETIADAILDRLVHTSYRIEMKGETLRKKR